MSSNELSQLQNVYLKQIHEIQNRLNACKTFLHTYQQTENIFIFESMVLQMRKILELLAFASIAPNYQQFSALKKNKRDTWHAKHIMEKLEKVNPDFYPIPLLPPRLLRPNEWHFDRKQEG